MSWVAINGFAGPNRKTSLPVEKPDGELVCSGSISCEFGPPGRRALRLVHYHLHDRWARGFTFFRNADGSLSMECRQGQERRYAKLTGYGNDCPDPLRVIFVWDALSATGHFSSENLKTGDIQSVLVRSPFPLPFIDCLRTVGSIGGCCIDPCVQVLALADHAIAVGPGATLAGDTRILTPKGERKISDLAIGDLVTTKANGDMPIRQIARQSVPAHGHTSPIHLRAPFFDLSKDLVMASKQRLLFSGDTTEFDFGNGGMLIEAGELVGLPGSRHQCGPNQMEYFQVLLDNHECIRACGTWTESLFIGQLAMQPSAVLVSIFSGVQPRDLPVHKKRALPILRNYEKRALFGSMIA